MNQAIRVKPTACMDFRMDRVCNNPGITGYKKESGLFGTATVLSGGVAWFIIETASGLGD
jgi:hypothetical protein